MGGFSPFQTSKFRAVWKRARFVSDTPKKVEFFSSDQFINGFVVGYKRWWFETLSMSRLQIHIKTAMTCSCGSTRLRVMRATVWLQMTCRRVMGPKLWLQMTCGRVMGPKLALKGLSWKSSRSLSKRKGNLSSKRLGLQKGKHWQMPRESKAIQVLLAEKPGPLHPLHLLHLRRRQQLDQDFCALSAGSEPAFPNSYVYIYNTYIQGPYCMLSMSQGYWTLLYQILFLTTQMS